MRASRVRAQPFPQSSGEGQGVSTSTPFPDVESRSRTYFNARLAHPERPDVTCPCSSTVIVQDYPKPEAKELTGSNRLAKPPISETNGTDHDSLRVCLASSPGGHLSELEAFVPGLEGREMFLVTVATTHSFSVFPGIRKRFVRRIERNPIDFLWNAFQAAAILIAEKPGVVVTTGAGDVVPLVLISASLGIPVVFIESVSRVRTPSLTGRIVRRWVDLIILPWPSLLKAYPKGIPVAPLLHPGMPLGKIPPDPSILVLTGTGPRGFDRLIREIDRLVREKKLSGRVFAQIGSATYLPKSYAYERFLPHARLMEILQSCDLVITHDGAGSIRESLLAEKPTIVVPHRPGTDEIVYRSSAELAHHLAILGWITLVENPADLPSVLSSTKARKTPSSSDAGRDAAGVLREFLHSLGSRSDSADVFTT